MFSINIKGMQINQDIKDAEVRLVGADGSQLGMYSSKDAFKMALDNDMDLVKIAPKANPPVCKIMDYNKFCFEQLKKEKEAKKNQRVTVVKEIQLSIRIESNDFKTKLNHALKFLANGDKVKVSLRFRGREITRPELGLDLMKRFFEECKEVASVEKPAKLDGRSIIMVLAPLAPKPVK